MAISSVARFEGYSYTYDVKCIDDNVIHESMKQFSALQEKGIIKNQSYYDIVWQITDEAETCSIDFTVNEIEYENHCKKILNCSAKQFQSAMRVLITSYFGADVKTLQKIARAGRKLSNFFSDKVNFNELTDNASELIDLLSLLPGESIQRDNLVDDFEDALEYSDKPKYKGNKQRKLSQYQTYFRFDDVLTKFWSYASDDEKLLYFPIYLWWKLTAILPLRPSEFVLTPRDCLQGKMLTIRRTKIKGKRLSSQYSIEQDYEKSSYKITDALLNEISWYVESTKKEYDSDIATLFSKNTQFRLSEISIKAEGHYTYNNLRECLFHFYKNVISKKFKIVEKNKEASLMDDVIEVVTLGDTRHIAMISLMTSGGNPVICKELAGHDSLEIGANYYGNIENFLDVLSFERHRMGSENTTGRELQTLEISNLTNISYGYCTSSKLKVGNFSDCISAVSFDGKLLDCKSCKYCVPNKIDNNAKKELRATYALLKYSVEQARRGIGLEESISSSLLKLQAAAGMYANNKILEHYAEESIYEYQGK